MQRDQIDVAVDVPAEAADESDVDMPDPPTVRKILLVLSFRCFFVANVLYVPRSV